MDNSLLLVNCSRIKSMVLLDEACDAPEGMDWNSHVSSGEIPGVIYEAFSDYMDYKEDQGDAQMHDLPNSMVRLIDKMLDCGDIRADELQNNLGTITVYYSDGAKFEQSLSSLDENPICYPVTEAYESGELFDGPFIAFTSLQEIEVILNMSKVSMIKLPLAKIERMIWHETEEILKDNRTQ